MKKIFVLLLLAIPFALQFCSSSKKIAQVPKLNYTNNIQPIMAANCMPCHFPPKGNKRPYDSYIAVRNDVDEIIHRITLNPDQRGFMPFKHPKLSDSTINVFVQWKNDGLLEK